VTGSSTGTAGTVLRIGTRGSALATTQSEQIAALLRERGLQCELVLIKTEGDVNRGPLATIGGTGVFVTAVRDALLDGRIDLAVHSYKDLPTAHAPGIRLAAVPPREDPADVLCAADGKTFTDLPPGAVVGTGSPRRVAQLLALRPDLVVRPIRGNVDTRLRMVTERTLDAVVLARAGLARLGRLDAVTHVFSPDEMLPAPAQGALAVESRDETNWFDVSLGDIDDSATRSAALAERTLLSVLEAGCSAPVGALATEARGSLLLRGAVVGSDGRESVLGRVEGPVPEAGKLGRRLAEDLLARGAGALMGSHR
jgi:hydroxymethylbilane synthase